MSVREKAKTNVIELLEVSTSTIKHILSSAWETVCVCVNEFISYVCLWNFLW